MAARRHSAARGAHAPRAARAGGVNRARRARGVIKGALRSTLFSLRDARFRASIGPLDVDSNENSVKRNASECGKSNWHVFRGRYDVIRDRLYSRVVMYLFALLRPMRERQECELEGRPYPDR